MSTYLHFEKFPRGTEKKTDVWEIQTKDRTKILGYIKWFGAFRKYSFFPEGKTIWDNKCLQEVMDFVTL